MSNDYMMWGPDRPENPRPIHGWDAQLDPSVVANVTFREQDDPEGAQAWLDSHLNEVEPEQFPDFGHPVPPEELLAENPAGYYARSVPFPPGNVRPPTTELVPEQEMTRGCCSACGRPAEQGPSGAWWHLEESCNMATVEATFMIEPPFQQGGWISGPCRFR